MSTLRGSGSCDIRSGRDARDPMEVLKFLNAKVTTKERNLLGFDLDNDAVTNSCAEADVLPEAGALVRNRYRIAA